ncbi:MAG: Gfo/Idh/MocA family oxidoreductase [Saprospiraceae bacterium]|nr:Gfo/Idh/MocA family oxidoreductase [Lewinella sp.]
MKDHILKVGVLGCGPIAQFAHFESCQKGKNVELHSICDRADDLLQRMAQIWHPHKTFSDFDKMLEDPKLDAVIIAVSDTFHVPLALKAVEAGKHVLVEKPLSHSIEECLQLIEAAEKHQLVVQVGHMKRFDEGISYAHDFIQEHLGRLFALKAWYCDNTQRYTATDNLQPLPIKSKFAVKPDFNEKADLERYYMMAHGSHLLDTAQYLAGKIGSVHARLRQIDNAWCWFVHVDFENGTLGHLDLTIKIRGDWHEGFNVYGEGGSVFGKTYNPWYYKSSEVQCYREDQQVSYSPLGADGFSYRRQLEAFAEVIMDNKPMRGTKLQEGLDIVKGMLAIKQSIREGNAVYLDNLKISAL